MKKACLYVLKPYQNNRIFDPASPLNRDNCLAFYRELKRVFLKNGVDLNTQDICPQEQADFVIFNEIPKFISTVKFPDRSAVFLFESELIRPNDWKRENHQHFKYVFTWNDELVDGKKYFKFNFTHGGKTLFRPFSERTGFCTLIAGNKRVHHPLELYSKRIEAIRWFEKNHPDKFEYYGVGWDLHTFSVPLVSKVLNRLTPLRRLLTQKWPLYRGKAGNKLELLSRFRFSICYENAQGIPGYITEKILDSMAAGCIPVYWGAPNVTQFVPKECFISKTDFSTYEELYSYLTGMTEAQFNDRLAAIKEFFAGQAHLAFDPAANARLVSERLLHG